MNQFFVLFDAPRFICHERFSVTTSMSPLVRPEISPVMFNPFSNETLLKKLTYNIGVFILFIPSEVSIEKCCPDRFNLSRGDQREILGDNETTISYFDR